MTDPVIDTPRATVLDPTHARPEPWFVGSGKGLRIAVVTLCAVLIVARGASTLWVMNEALNWWRSRPLPRPAGTLSTTSPQSPHPLAELPRPPAPPADPAKAGLKPRGNPGLAFSPDSYPADAIRAGEQGRVVALLSLDPGGSPTRCVVKTSSGSKSLDSATCRIAMTRVRFEPARDTRGKPVPSTYDLPVRWVLPTG